MPKTLVEANEFLCRHVLNTAYQSHPFWNEKRIDVWYHNISEGGIRKICDWEHYCDLARSPCQRRVSNDLHVVLNHQHYLVDDQFRGKKVEVWRGILDDGLFVRSSDGTIHGPYKPVPLPLPFGKFKKPKKSPLDQRRAKVVELAQNIEVTKESLFVDTRSELDKKKEYHVEGKTFKPESPTGALYFVNAFTAKEALYKEFGVPLGRLRKNHREQIDHLLTKTLRRETVMKEAKKIIEEYMYHATGNN